MTIIPSPTHSPLLVSRCLDCAMAFLPPRTRCLNCGGLTEAASVPLRGTVHAHTTIFLDAFGHSAPYQLAYVDLDEGGRALVRLQPGPDAYVDAPIVLEPSQAGDEVVGRLEES